MSSQFFFIHAHNPVQSTITVAIASAVAVTSFALHTIASPAHAYSVCRDSAAVTQAVTFSTLHKSTCYPQHYHVMNIQCALAFIR